MTRAVVFAYHNVGVRCLKVLLAQGVEISLVVTHDDERGENIWFDSVAATAAEAGIATIVPIDPNAAMVVERVRAFKPDFLFSFYYRRMLAPALLDAPSRGALNMHGSLLPKYRGRAPVNWAIIHGETETGATLHYMTAKPDDGDIVAQMAVPILPDDTARDVFDKVTVAAEVTLYEALPSLIAGSAPRIKQDLTQGAYFGGRTPEDGIIDWRRSARDIHNLIRAVAPPYPGATTTIDGAPVKILRSRLGAADVVRVSIPVLHATDDALAVIFPGGASLDIVSLERNGTMYNPESFVRAFGPGPYRLGP